MDAEGAGQSVRGALIGGDRLLFTYRADGLYLHFTEIELVTFVSSLLLIESFVNGLD